MKETGQIFASAEERRLCSENPCAALGLTPAVRSGQVETLRQRASEKYRQLARNYHPDTSDEKQRELFHRLKGARQSLDQDERSVLHQAYDLVFGPECAHWTQGMKDAAKPLVDVFVEVYGKASFLEGEAEECVSCDGRGFRLTNLEHQYLPLPLPCSDCGGEGALPTGVAELRDACATLFGTRTTFEPHWLRSEKKEEPERSQDHCRIALPPCSSLKECTDRYVLRHPHLCTRPFVTQMCSRLTAIANQAIECEASLSVLRPSYPPKDAIQRILDDCCLGISYLEARKGSREVSRLVEEQEWAKIVATGRTVRMREEQAYRNVKENNEFLTKRRDWLNRARRSMLVDALLGDLKKDNHLRCFRDCHAWRETLADAQRILRHADAMGVTADRCRELLQMRGLSSLLRRKDEPQTLGFHELAVFVASLGAWNGKSPSSAFELPESCFERFAEMFRYERSGDDEQDGFFVARHECTMELVAHTRNVFPENPHAAQQCLQALKSIQYLMNGKQRSSLPSHFAHREGDMVTESLRAGFPNAASLERYCRVQNPEEAFTIVADAEGTDTAHLFAETKRSLQKFPPPRTVVSLSPQKMLSLARSHSSVLDWHAVTELPPEKIAKIVSTLFATDDISAQALACNLVLLCLSVEDCCKGTDVGTDALFEEGSSLYRDLSRRKSRIVAILEQIDSVVLRYLVAYAQIIAVSHPSLEQLFTFFNEHTSFAAPNDLALWHPHWKLGSSAEVVEVVEQCMDDREDIGQIMSDAMHLHTMTISNIARILLHAHHSDDLHDTAYLRTLTRIMPDGIFGPACIRVMNVLLQEDSRINDIMEEVYAESGRSGFREAILDAPISIYRAPSGDALSQFPKHWTGMRKFLAVVSKRGNVLADFIAVLAHRKRHVADFLPGDPEEYKHVHQVTVFRRRALQPDDLPIIAKLTDGEHPYLRFILENALQSKRDIQRRLIVECLPPSDAAQITIALIADIAAKRNDCSTCSMLVKSLESPTGKVQRQYAFVAALLQECDEVREMVLQQLRRRGGVPLCEL